MGKTYSGLADAMVDYRARHGISQQKLADMCRTTKATIWRAESGKGGITKLTKAKIENVIYDRQSEGSEG